ncbi:hypothetical protein MPTK1_1g09050 [Marchantia polymorpha subsp. ruderalis]|uniref:Uncharacterized protein n=2 Tax=Marchantia polymorpha TaxID=3197 RepID=A0AAF6AN52_MARPO|nr:hypothetical protein MARPO_0036s0145 [Marchantia polymorpha]BBM97872.1 hypothetical protein Mp_1g09050 [Marchantia polymorpha subsp. ruderalis]|eukprot:PTQ41173.1 hypothetical protein MARPO_0036s0145 [Marchantia polymorpha]
MFRGERQSVAVKNTHSGDSTSYHRWELSGIKSSTEAAGMRSKSAQKGNLDPRSLLRKRQQQNLRGKVKVAVYGDPLFPCSSSRHVTIAPRSWKTQKS